jgi:hypothetical protein
MSIIIESNLIFYMDSQNAFVNFIGYEKSFDIPESFLIKLCIHFVELFTFWNSKFFKCLI